MGCNVYLKRVDLENFKSFGGKVSIPLMEGYMAITGPNGSGKSNITDAILFVLGPKSSKAMRAGKLTDLIYNGNKANGKVDSTKVTLYFDNTDRLLPWDSDEVRFTRIVKVSSDGEGYSSSFYVNDQRSSMAEFDSLLTRARISADGYNMVQQGDVTDITKMGNIERRRVLDSIAGISSYDADISKAQAEKAEAEQNMAMIEVVIGELKTQLAQLQKDMEAAKKYVEFKARLDMANAQYVHRQFINEEEKLKYTQENIAKVQKQIEDLYVKKDELNQKIIENDEAIAQKEKEIEAKVGPEYTEIKNSIEKIKIDKALSEDSISREQEQMDERQTDLEAQNESLKDADSELKDCLKSVSDTQIQIDTKTAALEEAKAENKRISDEMRNIGGEYKTLQDKLAKLEQDVETNGEEEHSIRAQAATAEAVDEESSRAVASLEQQISDADFEIKDAEWNLSKIKEEAGPVANIEEFGKKIMEMKKQESELEKREQDINSAIRRISQEYNTLAAEKKVSERMRGSDAVVAVLEMRDKGTLKGIHGTIAELGSVDPEFETALSVAAGGKMQAIIVDDDEVAAQAIAELKKTGHGRATFLPLNKMIEGKPRAKAIMVVKESLGYAIDLIDFKPEYRAAFWYVFADTIVVDNLSTARRLMGGVRIVTKGGELIEASGAMTGGTVRTQNIKFGAASQTKLDEVSAELRTANQSYDVIREKLADIRNRIREADNQMRTAGAGNIELQGKITKFEVKLGELREKRKRLKADLDEKKAAYSAANKNKNDLNVKLNEVIKKIEALKQERQKVRTRVAEIAPADLQQRMQTAMDAVYKLSGERNDLINSLAALNAEKSEYENNKRYIEKTVKELEDGIKENKAKIAEENEKLQKIKVDLDAMRAIERKMEEGIQDLTNAKDKMVEQKYKLENARENAITGIETQNGVKASMEASIIIIQKSIDEIKLQLAEIKVEVEEPIPSEETLKRTIRSCENAIAELGNVNLRAIEDYDEKKKRYDSLEEDVGRINAQIKDLNELTDNLGKKKKGLFMEVYDGVNANFKAIFSELSGGGEAFMALENEEDPFAGGLLINAKPKNGKMLRLDALSGGEKSLTALAFIFAIQEHQPSPFYVLDEVDMFLDSVNSEMVAQRIKKSSAKTQFIQVSLRKVTLSLADHLIGVTRPPNGVSRVIMQPNLAEVSKYEEEAQRRIEEAEKQEKDGKQ